MATAAQSSLLQTDRTLGIEFVNEDCEPDYLFVLNSYGAPLAEPQGTCDADGNELSFCSGQELGIFHEALDRDNTRAERERRTQRPNLRNTDAQPIPAYHQSLAYQL
jgi:hypothetical protein